MHQRALVVGVERQHRVELPPRGSRLAELTGGPVTVTTPSATAELGAGSALVSVDDAGLSTVANHDGRPVALAGKAGGQVAVKAGMGTRVARGQYSSVFSGVYPSTACLASRPWSRLQSRPSSR